MRKRSNAVHAESFEDFRSVSIRKAAESKQTPSSPYQTNIPTSETKLQEVKAARERMKNDPDLWKEFNFCAKSRDQEKYDNYEEISQASTNEDGPLSGCESPLIKSLEDFGSKITKMFNIMAISSKEVGIHSLIDNLFGDNSAKNSLSASPFDLVVKEHETFEHRYKFKFWIQDPAYEKHQLIIDVYYSSIPFYMFVYKQSSRQSFNCLSSAIEKIKMKANKEKFIGILVCDKDEEEMSYGSESCVSDEEAEAFCQKYGLFKKLTTNELINKEKIEVFKLMNRKPAVNTAEFLLERCLFKQEPI